MSEEKPKVKYEDVLSKVEKYLYEYNVPALINVLTYLLGERKIYFNPRIQDILLVYMDYLVGSFIVTFVMRFGVVIKVYIGADKDREYVEKVDAWYVSE
jgi:hypothetical protein